MTSFLSAELAATCSAIGYYEPQTKKYYADENTLETVKDLIRYLIRDSSNHEIRRQLGETKVLQTDLLPLLKSYWQQNDLFDILLRLIVNLTAPPLVLYNEEIPKDKMERRHFMQIEEHLQCYKSAFADEAIWAILSTRFSQILEIDPAERTEENGLIIERILILIRNILYVAPDPLLERRPDNDATIHDQVLWSLHQSGMLDIILYVSSSPNEQPYYMHVLEILYYSFRDQNPTHLAKSELQRNQSEKQQDESELVTIRQKECLKKQQKSKIYTSARHSRFGGTFVAQNLKAVGDNNFIFHKPVSKIDEMNFGADKNKPKIPNRRKPIKENSMERRSAFSIRLFLREFCVEFLNASYNTLMYEMKSTLVRQKSMSHDALYYFWAVRFFMEFNRSYKFEVKLVSETMSIQSFHYVQQNMENYFDMMQTDKGKLHLWARRLHIALLAYRELLLSLLFMDKSPDGSVRDSSKVIKSNIFYVLEYRELVLTLLVTFDEKKMSDLYLRDLIETQHIFLKLFESFCKSGSILVQKKNKTKSKKKKTGAVRVVEINWENRWDEIAAQISTILESNEELSGDVVPFDAASDVPIDEQKSEAMLNIQRKLRDGEMENGIKMLRAARDVWPENDSFGNAEMSPEEEFMALRDIFLADLGENQSQAVVAEQPIFDVNEEEEDSEEEERRFSETDFKFEDFVKRLAHPKILRACCMALSKFEQNSTHANHCIVKLLHRIAFDCKMYVMLFQVSIFATFRKIFAMKQITEYKDLVKFAIFITRKFFEVAKDNKMIFIESLFWKNSKDAFDVEHGYGSYQEQSKGMARVWTEQDEDELRRLFMEHQEKQLEDDVIDWIISNLIDNTRSRKAIIKKLKEMYLLTDYKGPRKPSKSSARVPTTWGPEEEEQLQELFEKFKDAMDPMGMIMDHLTVQRPKNRIIEKLLVMGLISDRKEVRKKRAKGASGSRKKHGPSRSDSEHSSDDENEPYSSKIRNNSTKISKKTTKKYLPAASSKDVAINILKIESLGLTDALDWLKDSLADALEDWDENDEEGVPLVPIMDLAIAAVENQDFQALLKCLGFLEPIEETYWKLPANINLKFVKENIDMLSKALDGSLTVPEDVMPSEQSNEIISSNREEPSESSDDEDVFQQLRNQPTNRVVNTDDNSNDTENQDKNKQNKDGNRNNDSSDDEDVFQQLRKQPRNHVINDDDNSNDTENQVITKQNEDVNSNNDSSDDEDVFQKLKKPLQESSDDDDEPSVLNHKAKSTKKMIISDESADDEYDALEKAEEKLKQKKLNKKKEKKEGSTKTTKSKKKDDSAKEKKNTKVPKAPKKAEPKQVFQSREFLSTDDSSSGEETRKNIERRKQEEVNKLVMSENKNTDVEDSKKKKSTIKRKPVIASSSEDEGKENINENMAKSGDKRRRETDSDENEIHKKEKLIDSEDEEDL